MVYRVVLLGILASVFTLNLPAQAETCKAIPLIGGQGNSVTKTVSVPTIPAGPLGMLGVDITRNNWNTDWAVPNNVNFRRYIATITSQDVAPLISKCISNIVTKQQVNFLINRVSPFNQTFL